MRYKELPNVTSGVHGEPPSDLPYDIEGYLTQIDTGIIDAEYMNSRFKKYIKLLMSADPDSTQKLKLLLMTFTSLLQPLPKRSKNTPTFSSMIFRAGTSILTAQAKPSAITSQTIFAKQNMTKSTTSRNDLD